MAKKKPVVENKFGHEIASVDQSLISLPDSAPPGRAILLQLLRHAESVDVFAVTGGHTELQQEVHKLLSFLVQVVQLRKAFRHRPEKPLASVAELMNITRNALYLRMGHLGLQRKALEDPESTIDDLLRFNGPLVDLQ